MCLKDFMMRILVVDDLIRLVMVRSAGADDFTMWILAVPTYTLGAAGLGFWNGGSGAM